MLATPTYSGGERIVCFFHLNISTFVCFEYDHLNNIPNKKQRIILTVVSKHFGHVTFYAADVESGLMR